MEEDYITIHFTSNGQSLEEIIAQLVKSQEQENEKQNSFIS